MARVRAALAANAFGQAVTVGSLLVLTPLFFKHWGAATYGEWLILSSIPAYLAMADLGIGSAAGNEMAMRSAAGDRQGARQTYKSALWVAAGAGALATLAGLLGAGTAGLWGPSLTPSISASDVPQILVALAMSVALALPGGVVSAGFRCCDRNALGLTLANSGRLLEAVVTAALLLLGKFPLWVCIGTLTAKAVMLLVQLCILRRVCPWLFLPNAGVDRQMLRRLIAPSLGFLTFPLGNAVSLQGPILVIGAVFDGSAVAMFSALRTLARVAVQVTNLFSWSVGPEMTRAFGAGDLPLLRRLHRASWGVTCPLILVLAAAQAVLGEWLVRQWLGPSAPYDAIVFKSLLLITVVSAIWAASLMVMISNNRHLTLGLVYVGVNSACIGLAALLSPAFGWFGLLGPMLLAEAVLLAFALPAALRLTEDRWSTFFRDAVAELLDRLGCIRCWQR